VPPYWGVPRLSHQFPVLVVVAAVVTGIADVVDVGILVGLVDVGITDAVVVVEVGVIVVVVAVVDEEQDASTSEPTRIKVSAIQIIPFFNLPPII
jgi:hypothetical protein